MKIPSFIDGFFFRRINASGFGLMRMAWAFCTLAFFLMQWKDVGYYYSEYGILPDHLTWIVTRTTYHFTLLEWIKTPIAVSSLFLILHITLVCMFLGVWPRVMTILSVLLVFSFHERNPMILGGGDTLMRNIGFLLMLAPGIDAFSLQRLQKQWHQWKKERKLLPAVTMPIWPWRLLLWQMIVLYGTSLWYKSLGTMWWNGTAVEATFHHPVYARWPMNIMNTLMPIAGIGDSIALLWQGAWLLLLIPRIPLRRLLIIGGIFFHGGIFLLMDAGIFSLMVFTAYLGLLREEDFVWLKKILNNNFTTLHFSLPGPRPVPRSSESEGGSSRRSVVGFTFHFPVTVLYDGRCGLCLCSIFALQIVDWLGRLRYANFRNEGEQKAEAPDLTEATLDRAMHIHLPDGRYLQGYDAFRSISWHIPVLWLVIPFLYIPGVPTIGRRIYAKIAENRRTCDHLGCSLGTL